eukprot:1152389-Pelagomonas_calceolata.AAC.1
MKGHKEKYRPHKDTPNSSKLSICYPWCPEDVEIKSKSIRTPVQRPQSMPPLTVPWHNEH